MNIKVVESNKNYLHLSRVKSVIKNDSIIKFHAKIIAQNTPKRYKKNNGSPKPSITEIILDAIIGRSIIPDGNTTK